MLHRRFALICALLLLPMTLLAQTRDLDGVPLPLDVASNQAGQSDSFLGAWSGLWGQHLKHILVVEKITPNGSAEVIYAYGDLENWGIKKDWKRHSAKVQGDTLTITETGFTATYQKLPSGVLIGNFSTGRGLSQAVLRPLDLNTAQPEWSTAKFGTIHAKLGNDSAAIKLETVTFTPPGSGPFPLAIVNHGSTGNGKNPAVAKLTFFDAAIAQFLMDRGYMVVFPQRRGRGKSDGVYDEGFRDDRTEGYSCATRRSLAGAERAITDLEQIVAALSQQANVKSGPILLSGISRGGLLSMAYAGRHPEQVSGVINFVGGWMGDRCPNAEEINDTLFIQAAEFPHETLSLYGKDDLFYSTQHTHERFKTFQAHGGKGTYHAFDVPGGNGHGLSAAYGLWSPLAEAYLENLKHTK